MLSRLQSFDNLQASEFAATQVVPTAGIHCGCQGSRGVYVRAQRGLLPPRASDMLAVRIRAIDGKGLSPSRFAALPAATRTFTSKLLNMPSTPLNRYAIVARGGSSLVLIPRDEIVGSGGSALS